MRSSYLTCPAVLYREEDQDDNWNEEKESDEVGCLQDRRSLTGRSNEDHRLAQRERERERERVTSGFFWIRVAHGTKVHAGLWLTCKAKKMVSRTWR